MNVSERGVDFINIVHECRALLVNRMYCGPAIPPPLTRPRPHSTLAIDSARYPTVAEDTPAIEIRPDFSMKMLNSDPSRPTCRRTQAEGLRFCVNARLPEAKRQTRRRRARTMGSQGETRQARDKTAAGEPDRTRSLGRFAPAPR